MCRLCASSCAPCPSVNSLTHALSALTCTESNKACRHTPEHNATYLRHQVPQLTQASKHFNSITQPSQHEPGRHSAQAPSLSNSKTSAALQAQAPSQQHRRSTAGTTLRSAPPIMSRHLLEEESKAVACCASACSLAAPGHTLTSQHRSRTHAGAISVLLLLLPPAAAGAPLLAPSPPG